MFNNRPSLFWLLHRIGLGTACTQTSAEERKALQEFAAGKRRLVEIGVHQGVTTRCLAGVMAPDGEYFAVDPYFPGRLGMNFNRWIALNEVARGSGGQVQWVQATGADAVRDARLQGRPVDFLFIDGDHSYEGLRSDWEAWRPMIAPSGIVALHDTRGNHFGCQKYMEDVILPDPDFGIVAEVDRLTIFQRIGSAVPL